MKKIISVIFAAMFAVSAFAVNTASAATADAASAFKIEATSNLFPAKTAEYSDINSYADDNGDIYVTVDYDLCAPGKSILNYQINNISWDPEVLEFDMEANTVQEDRNGFFNLQPLLTEQGFAGGFIYNTNFIDEGWIACNFSNISAINRLYAYDSDDNGNPVPGTFVRLVFKVIDPAAASTNVNLNVVQLALDDEDSALPDTKYIVAYRSNRMDGFDDIYSTSTKISPEGDAGEPVEPSAKIGDVNLDGTIDVFDASAIQKYAVDKITLTDEQLYVADVNDDKEVNVLDSIDIQKYTVDKITDFKKKAA